MPNDITQEITNDAKKCLDIITRYKQINIFNNLESVYHNQKVIPTIPLYKLDIKITQQYEHIQNDICDILKKHPYLLRHVPMLLQTPQMINIVLNNNASLISYVNPFLVEHEHMEYAFLCNTHSEYCNYSFLQHLHESLLVKYEDIICDKLYNELYEIAHINIQKYRGSVAAKNIYNILFYRCAENIQYLGTDCVSIIASYLDG
jgi:hypothetical protein